VHVNNSNSIVCRKFSPTKDLSTPTTSICEVVVSLKKILVTNSYNKVKLYLFFFINSTEALKEFILTTLKQVKIDIMLSNVLPT